MNLALILRRLDRIRQDGPAHLALAREIEDGSEVSREGSNSIEEKVDRALERCFTMKTRSIARAKAAKATATTRVSARRTAKAS